MVTGSLVSLERTYHCPKYLLCFVARPMLVIPFLCCMCTWEQSHHAESLPCTLKGTHGSGLPAPLGERQTGFCQTWPALTSCQRDDLGEVPGLPGRGDREESKMSPLLQGWEAIGNADCKGVVGNVSYFWKRGHKPEQEEKRQRQFRT